MAENGDAGEMEVDDSAEEEDVQRTRSRPHRRSSGCFRSGKARGAYERAWGDDRGGGVDVDDADSDGRDRARGPPKKKAKCGCRTVLEAFRDHFSSMCHTSKRRNRGQHAEDDRSCRDLSKQNEWLIDRYLYRATLNMLAIATHVVCSLDMHACSGRHVCLRAFFLSKIK